MGIRFRVNHELRLGVVVLDGIVTDQDFGQLIPHFAHPGYNLMALSLVDATGAERITVPSETVRQAARTAEQHVDEQIGSEARVALVATRDEFFGLARMYEMLRGESPVEIRVFRELADAESWLGLPVDYATKLTDVL